MKKYFHRKSEMTEYAQSTGLEMIRCKQTCEHVKQPVRPAILLIKHNSISERLVKCKVCMLATTQSETQESEAGKDLCNE